MLLCDVICALQNLVASPQYETFAFVNAIKYSNSIERMQRTADMKKWAAALGRIVLGTRFDAANSERILLAIAKLFPARSRFPDCSEKPRPCLA